ncbi:PREDICTED: uncharacterized protein LOC105366148 [Ceratosolen solmsi marchali]|uniref:Uncharacterized protein LOC105366148 n=1 Tax=Ceratosolen solmsi marchali TaxID=326594 RepID=A0AAJ6YRB4_9HYME|nr:PREDICTED: uncharacterized protein LOC105366148 [Ceratosolen solmsi marchali]
MCEQTEINYLDGDVVWVKLGSYWWPGQVIGIEKLPEDIQIEFKKKPIIAAVKFFQEDSFEFVKNYQQIYKYNCRQKEEFIRKGLDKYRVKSKDGFNYMDKFPEDVKTAEILTNGDPYILLNKKFNPEEKPDISGLFGEKKIVKKKRNREDLIKKINNDIPPRVTHPRFLQENDHEVRIRQQPKTLPLSSSTYSSARIYPCHVCGFTATRVNVIICHLKNHRLNKETEGISKSKLKSGMHLKQKHTNLNLPKRKYIRKLVSCKIKNDNVLKLGKRKYCKQIEKPIKKKKSDPELREKLLADWNVDTDEDESSYFDKSTNDSSVDLSNNKLSYLESTDEAHILKMKSLKYNSDSIILLQASNKILHETDNLTNLSMLEEDKRNLDKINIEQTDMEKTKEDIHINNIIIEKSFLKDDKKSRLSCFDFDEDDVPEPSISSVRKIPRSLGSKNMSIKKEIIKEFQMSQALLTDEEILFKNNEINEVNKKINKFAMEIKNISKPNLQEDIELKITNEETFDIKVEKTKYMTDLPVNYKFENQNNPQMEILPTESTLHDILKVDNKNTIIKDNINFAIKKRRGRPKKKKAIIEDVSDDEYLKSDNLKKKSPIKKISNTDSDCSYDIRKQKSNQKNESLYLPKSDYRLSKNNENLNDHFHKASDDKKNIKNDISIESNKTQNESSLKLVKTCQNNEVNTGLNKEINKEVLVKCKEISTNVKNKLVLTKSVPEESSNSIHYMKNFSITDNFNNVEVAVTDSSKIEEKSKEKDPFINDKNIIIPLNNKSLNNKNNNLIMTTANLAVNEDNKKIDVPINSILTTLSSTLDMKNTVPVKKREKPRIIENVALKEPMILKTKLMDKHIGKIGKHKLESENIIIDELKKISKAKLMKMETVISNSKSKFHTISNTNIRNQQIIAALPQTVSRIPYTEKYIQQSSQSLVDMDLDINSMPFVLSEDVLTPESIEQMPVLISSVLPAKVPITTLSTTLITSKETYSANQSFDSVKDRSEICSKKKTGMPTILKNKNKVKPTITSIKTIVPPLSNTTYKGNFKLNTQALTSLDNNKIPGKYVIVQTSGHQQAYSTHPKVSIPTSKGSGNAQIVQQGSKVVILTSSQSGQSGQKVLPLNSISKALNTGNVQRIITSKQGPEMYNSISSKNFISCKNISASSSDLNSSMSSKLAGQKILGQQQIVSSKTILTQLPGAITKSTILGTLPQGILTKEGIFTPINTSTLGGKTIISSKTLVTKGFPHQSINTQKNSLTQSLSNKAIINSQGIVSKGTILTPITGSQVKALAAKNIKGNKLQYQIDQHKVQLGGIQKHSNVPISSSLVRSTNFKTSSSVMVLQKADLKTITSNKKHIKQTVQKQISETTVLTPPTIMSIQQKSKGSTDLEQKIISSKNINHSINLQQKIIAEKDQDTKLNSVVNNEALALKTIFEQKKQVASTLISKSNKGTNKVFHKKISNLANSVTLSSNANANLSMTIPFLEPINHEKVPKKEDILEQISSKKETVATSRLQMDGAIESTISVQSQIMALPTENSDGTQTYVLVTVDEQGHIVPLDNNALMSLEGTSNLDENRTLYIDSSSLTESGNIDNIILQIDNGSLSNIQTTNVPEPVPSTVIEALPSIQSTQTTNQDILAAALANTDFQQEIGVLDCSPSTTITNLTQTSLINQTILQSTIIPPTEPISSPLVLETSLTLNQPIMTPLEIPSTLSIQSELTPVTSITTVPTSLALPVTENNQNISYIIAEQPLLQISEKPKETKLLNERVDIKRSPNAQLVQDDKQIQTIPSMPIIEDTFNANNGFDSTNTSVIEDKLKNYVTKTSEELIQDLTGNDSLQLQESNDNLKNSSDKICLTQEIISETPQIIINHIQDDSVSSQENTNLIKQSQKKVKLEHTNKLNKIKEKLNTAEDNTDVYAASSESSNKIQSRIITNEASEATVIIGQSTISQESLILNEELPFKKQYKETKLMKVIVDKEETIELNKKGNVCHTANLSVKDELNQVMLEEYKITFLDEKSKTNKQIPTQSYKQFISASSNIINDPSQSAKFENLQKTTKSFSYESLKTDQNTLIEEVSTQIYKDSKQKESFQSHKNLSGINTNSPTQSFKEIMTLNDKTSINKCIDDSNFSNQNFNIEKIENYVGNMKTETNIGQECISPSQSNDICVDGIGTSSTSINNLVLNEDETASSSYVPETPENQERDQDQESAISTSSYEIPTCEELNISSSNIIPDTSIQSEHSSIHNNGVPEIPTSSYNLNPDSSSTHIIAVPTSNYEDEIIIEQNVSTSYEVPISIGSLEKTGLRNYVTDGSEHRNESSNYYPHEEVTESYYESMCKRSSTQLESNSEEEAAPSYYESNSVDVTSETSQSYFNQDEVTHSYDNHDISSNYYDSQIENEASASFYSTHELDTSAESTLQNVETTQNFYQENRDGQFHEQEEATPTYTDRYSLDYVPINTALDRHDLVDSSITAKSMDSFIRFQCNIRYTCIHH